VNTLQMGSCYLTYCGGHRRLSPTSTTRGNLRVVSGFDFADADIVGSAYYKWVSMFLDFQEQFLAIRITAI
jgi:hypothetical protein